MVRDVRDAKPVRDVRDAKVRDVRDAKVRDVRDAGPVGEVKGRGGVRMPRMMVTTTTAAVLNHEAAT